MENKEERNKKNGSKTSSNLITEGGMEKESALKLVLTYIQRGCVLVLCIGITRYVSNVQKKSIVLFHYAAKLPFDSIIHQKCVCLCLYICK